MNKKMIGLLAIFTLLLLVIAQVPAQATTPLPDEFTMMQGMVTSLWSTVPEAQATSLLAALTDFKVLFADYDTSLLLNWLPAQGNESQPITFVKESPVPLPTQTSTSEAGLPVIPGTWTPPISLATNAGPANVYPEFNPAIAANPTNPANQVEGQFDVDAANIGTGMAMRCTIRVSPFATAVPRFLPVDGVAAAAGGLSFCTRALPAYSTDGATVYVLYTDYEFQAPAVSYTSFKLLVSHNGGVAWTNVAGAALPAGPVANGFGTIRQFPFFGPPSGELPVTPSLAVSGNGATANLHVAYATFTNLVTNDIRSISSLNGGVSFSNPVIIESINPFLPGPLRLLLAPSNAYVMPGIVHVVWYDDIALPPMPLGGAYILGHAASNDNGVTYTAPGVLVVGSETLVLDINSPNLMFLWPTHFPHIAADAATNSIYVVSGNTWSPVAYPVSNEDIFMVYSHDGGATWNNNWPFPEWHTSNGGQFYPAVTVQHSDGTVHVTYASREEVLNIVGLPGFAGFFHMIYTAATPAQLQPGVEQWLAGQVVAAWVPDSLYLGTFFSVAASTANVYPAWTSGTAAAGPSIMADNTWVGMGTKQTAAPVGGTALSTDMLTLLMPYMLIAVFATIGLAYVLRRRFRSTALPQIPNIRA
jgi:hypothetical protein